MGKSLSIGYACIKKVEMCIPMYWTSITVVPKGILTIIKKLSFQFPQSGSKLIGGICFLKWIRLAFLKNLDIYS
jgi:hypothetical protein